MVPRHIVFGVHITDRLRQAVDVQRLFTEYGRHIKTRLGLHEVGPEASVPSGIVLLEMYGEELRCMELKDKLNAIAGVEVKQMIFEHPQDQAPHGAA